MQALARTRKTAPAQEQWEAMEKTMGSNGRAMDAIGMGRAPLQRRALLANTIGSFITGVRLNHFRRRAEQTQYPPEISDVSVGIALLAATVCPDEAQGANGRWQSSATREKYRRFTGR